MLSYKSFRMKLDGKATNFPLWSTTVPVYNFLFTAAFQAFLLYRIFPEKIRNLSLLNDIMNLTKQLSWNKMLFLCYTWWGKECILWNKSLLRTHKNKEGLSIPKIILSAKLYILHRNLYLPAYRHSFSHTHIHALQKLYLLIFALVKQIFYEGKFLCNIDWSLLSLYLKSRKHVMQHPTVSVLHLTSSYWIQALLSWKDFWFVSTWKWFNMRPREKICLCNQIITSKD